ncbi:BrnT family toxin [Desulfococcus sp.]|uniref:BrnT family toxin n=1 Tax=Desulfococcus sp. TaxID=2025834 RepID=UPI0035936111
MKITWDPQKAETNLQKHKIRFSDAEVVLSDPFAMTLEDQDVLSEQRFVTIGTDAVGRTIVVVYSYRGDTIRLISARKATSSEREHYEKGI